MIWNGIGERSRILRWRGDHPSQNPAPATVGVEGSPQKVVAIIQARMGSLRLPGKSLMRIRGIPLLQYVIERTKRAGTLDMVVLATSTNEENDPLCALAESLGIGVYRGSEEDVLSRFTGAARETGADCVVRICADNPLVDPGEIDRLVRHHVQTGSRYSFNHVPTIGNRYPDGLGAEVIDAGVLAQLEKGALSSEEREHVTLRLRRQKADYLIGEPVAPPGIMGPDIKLDIDTPEDFERMREFIESLPGEGCPFWPAEEIVRCYRAHFHSRVLFILHGREDARVFCNNYLDRVAGAVPLAASPESWWELEKRGVSCLLIQDYFEREGVYRQGMQNYKILETMCGIMDSILGESNAAVRTHNIQPAKCDFDSEKHLLDNLCIKANLLHTIIGRERPGLICVPIAAGNERLPDHDPDAFFRQDLNWYGHLLRLESWGCRVVELPHGDGGQAVPVEQQGSMASRLSRKVLGGSSPLYSLLYTLKNSGLQAALRLAILMVSALFSDSRELFMLGYGYDWNRVLLSLYRRGYSIHSITVEAQECRQPGGEPETLWEGKLSPLLTFDGVDLSPLIVPYLALQIRKTLSCIPGAIQVLNLSLERAQPVAFLSGPRAEPVEHLLAQLAREHSIPVITWQHGAYGAHKAPIMLYSEFMNSDIILTWGKGVDETMQADPLNTFPCRTVPVGSLFLEDIQKRGVQEQGSQAILYVTTNYYGNRMYVSYDYPLHDNELWETQKAILDAIGNRRRAFLKLHPGSSSRQHIDDYIEHRGYSKNISVKQRDPLPELLANAGVVIIDFPSTTLLQAIAAGKTVFILTRHIRLSEVAMAMLRKRAYCSEDLQEFTGTIQRYLAGEPVPEAPDINNTEFLEHYGVHRRDGRVTERVLEVLDEVTNT